MHCQIKRFILLFERINGFQIIIRRYLLKKPLKIKSTLPAKMMFFIQKYHLSEKASL